MRKRPASRVLRPASALPRLAQEAAPGVGTAREIRFSSGTGRRTQDAGRRTFGLIALVSAILTLAGCGSRSVDVVDSHTDLHLSGNWSDADSRAVAEQVGQRLAEAPWIADFVAEHGRPPVLRVGRVVVRTRALDDLVDPAIVTNDLTRALIASGKVRVVADRAETVIQGQERQDLADHAAQPAAQRAGLAADVVLGGTLLTQDDRVLDRGLTGTYRQVKFYQFDLAVTALGSNEVLWRDSVERKKTIEQSTTGW